MDGTGNDNLKLPNSNQPWRRQSAIVPQQQQQQRVWQGYSTRPTPAPSHLLGNEMDKGRRRVTVAGVLECAFVRLAHQRRQWYAEVDCGIRKRRQEPSRDLRHA